MRRSTKALLLSLLIAAALMFCAVTAFADVGNFAGDSDWGGGSDWSDSDWGSDSDWSYDSGGSYGSSGGILIGGGSFWIFAAIVIVLIVIWNSRKKNRTAPRGTAAPGPVPTSAAQLRPISELREIDPAFSEAMLREKIANLYVQMQNAWQEKAWEPMRAHMTDSLFSQLERQLSEYIRNGQTNRVERIAVLGTELTGWAQDERNDRIVARLQTRIVDYVVDDRTGAILRGSSSRELFMEYEWTLIRTKGVKTPLPDASGEAETMHCPSCGAPLDAQYSAKCEYCGSVVKSSDYDWVIASIRGLSQRSGT